MFQTRLMKVLNSLHARSLNLLKIMKMLLNEKNTHSILQKHAIYVNCRVKHTTLIDNMGY
jgi:hypothetical protein